MTIKELLELREKSPLVPVLQEILKHYNSQAQMARAFDVSPAFITKILNGKIREISPKQLRKIAEGSKGVAKYIELMIICRYITDQDIYEYLYNKEIKK